MKTTRHLALSLWIGSMLLSCQPSKPDSSLNPQPTDYPPNPVLATDISNRQVNAFAEDSMGHIWIATFRGLNKYDAYEYQQYFCTDDSLGPQDNQIKDLLRDREGRLWVSSVNGLSVYTDHDTFRHIPTDLSNRNGVQLLETRDGRILVSTLWQLGVYDPESGRLKCVLPRLSASNVFFNRCHVDADNRLWVADPVSIRCYDSKRFTLQDSIPLKGYPTHYYFHTDGTLWLTGNGNLQVFDCQKQAFLPAPDILRRHPVLSHSEIELIHPYGDHGLLLNTANDGLFYYDSRDGSVSHQDEKGFPFEAPRFKISTFFTDSWQNLWIGSTDQGYAVAYHYKERFNSDNYLRTFLKNKSVRAVAAEGDRALWLTTLKEGVYRYDLQGQRMEQADLSAIYPDTKPQNIHVNQMLVDRDGYLWFTFQYNEVVKCRQAGRRLLPMARYRVSLPMSITQDRAGHIIVGTATPYVHILQADGSGATSVNAFGNGFTFIPGLLPLPDGQVLMAALDRPLTLLNPATGHTEELPVHEGDFRQCVRRSIFIPTALCRHSQGDIYIGTVSNGLLRYTPSTGRLVSLPGAACTDISSIEEDREGNLWIGTLYGLSKLDCRTGRFINYYADDGTGGNQFCDRASCHLPDGTLALGGTHGLTFFNPLLVTHRRDVPLLFENLKVHNRLMHPAEGKDACIERHLTYAPDIHLSYRQNGFSISFAALDYNEYQRINYHYCLEGFDHYWIDARHNREAYYANLPAGTYTFRVQATNNDQGAVEAENAIRIIVHPAPWNTWWARLLYLLAAAVVIALFVRNRQRIRAEKAAIRRAEEEKEQEQRVNRMNMSFFANVSHEFRTPLTMIAGPVRQLCGSPAITGNDKDLLRIVWRSVERMLILVNQLMDFNKLENDTLKLQVRHTDIIGLLQRITDVFRINAHDKGINLSTFGLEDSFLTWLDEDKVHKVFGNLMANALKFTPAGGSIRVDFDVVTREQAARLFPLTDRDRDTLYVQVSVSNTGKPIPPAQRERIFERYYQLDDGGQHGHYNQGTGIGLYYARSLVRLHHGHMLATDPVEGTGARFIFILPVNDISYTTEERTPDKQERQAEAFPLPDTPAPAETDDAEKETDDRQTLLVVDDDTEVAHYLHALLSPYYRVICRFNVDTALQAMREEAPDLVLSDVVMPGKDGFALCREIKNDLQLCHVPVILLTAKTSVDEQVTGLNSGADAYVTKPFDPDYLLALVRSQLDNRAKIRSLLGQSTQTDELDENLLLPQDAAFMTDLYKLMENELSNPELDIARMTELLKVSRTKFYYKVKGLTGESPSTFFKTYKLNRAAELIAEGRYTMAEIADMTGFSTPSRFTKNFKKQFGVPPSEYHKKTVSTLTGKDGSQVNNT